MLFGIQAGLVALFKFFKTPADAMTKLLVLLAQAPSPTAPGTSGLWQMAPLVLMFAAMYFLLIAPQRTDHNERRYAPHPHSPLGR